MNAVVDIRGVQFRVAMGDEIIVPRLSMDPGSKITLDRVLLLDEGATITVGKPWIAGAAVESTILKHGRGKKIIVFKFKRRKDQRVKNGHRQPYTVLSIDTILQGGAAVHTAESMQEEMNSEVQNSIAADETASVTKSQES